MTPHPPLFQLFPYTTLFRSIEMLSAQLVSGNTVQFTYETAGDPGPFEVGLYRSTDGVTYNPADRIGTQTVTDRKSTRLNSSHVEISYAVFCLKKKNKGVRTIVEMSRGKSRCLTRLIEIRSYPSELGHRLSSPVKDIPLIRTAVDFPQYIQQRL